VRVFFDTSVLVAAMVASHPAHQLALMRLQKIKDGTDYGIVAAHSVAELYAILTRLPVQPRITSAIAQQLIKHNVIDICEVIALSNQDYATLVDHLADVGIIGGATYDALILHAAALAHVDQIITLNEKDFRRVYPSLSEKIASL
jgi:predicted nucleic acid-binding protein